MYPQIIFLACRKGLTGRDEEGYNGTHEVMAMNEQEMLAALRQIIAEETQKIVQTAIEPLKDEIAKINITLEHKVDKQLNLLRENQMQMHQDIKTLQGVKDFSIEASLKATGASFTAEKALELAQNNETRICTLEQKVGM